MHTIRAENMDEIQRVALRLLLEQGQRVQPRGNWVQEITCASFQLQNPRARLISSPARRFSLTFAVGELLWYLRGSNQTDIIAFYNGRHRCYSDDGTTLYGAYGPRLFAPQPGGITQWEAVLSLLRADRDTRQAVLHLHFPSDLQEVSRDIPCTCSLHFLIRQNRLECMVVMRSNDVIWGMPYDVFSFTMLQEIMARQLDIEVGTYTHVVGSFHLYDRHLTLAKRIVAESPSPLAAMPEMPEQPWHHIGQLLSTEEQFRLSGQAITWPTHPYWLEFAQILQAHGAYRHNNEQQFHQVMQTLHPRYATLLSQQFQKMCSLA